MKGIERKLTERLTERFRRNALRRLPPLAQGLDFCSNDYLGLARSAELRQAVREAADLPVGSTGSRLITGNSPRAEALEQQLAAFHRAEAGLLFTSGYGANIGLLSCIADRHDVILYDQLVHASIRDGLRLSRARHFPFRHNDLDHLQQKLDRISGNIFLVVESVYSMDGDEAPLAGLVDLAERYGAALIVDEAHATGVFGPRGEGLVVEQGLAGRVWARLHTFGKALGCHGAVVVGPAYLRDYLLNFAGSFIYTTALPESAVAAIDRAYAILRRGDRQRELRRRIDHFLQSLSEPVRRQIIPSRSAIQSLLWPGNDAVKALAGQLQQAGFDVRPILHPTVPPGQERLRICLHAHNRPADVNRLAGTLHQLIAVHV